MKTAKLNLVAAFTVVGLLAGNAFADGQNSSFRTPPGKLDLDYRNPPPKQEPLNNTIREPKSEPSTVERVLSNVPLRPNTVLDSDGNKAHGASIEKKF